ncbi:MAG: DNA-3-methyladenine glycosylase 2 family protein [Acholeplasmataceae bacterium]|nr:MAG: DNA-3-methyladenine glycosylase 2 family protein [Acholeplasmataceae bacterium]
MSSIIYHRQSEEVIALSAQDPQLVVLFDRVQTIEVKLEDNPFLALVKTMIAQQLSSKVANVITQRLMDHFQQHLTPEGLLLASDEQLRQLGMSRSKVTYLKALAEAILKGDLTYHALSLLTDEEVIRQLTMIKGIGRWTAEMFLMFTLGREDVFSVLDLGLRNAVKVLYQDDRLTPRDILDISQRWRPYRSVASHYLWHLWDFPDDQQDIR